MYDDASDDGACWIADAALGVEHVALLRPERLCLPEHLPSARAGCGMLLRAARVLGKVQPEPADAIACAVIELDRGSQTFAIQRRALPDREGAVRAHAGTHLCGFADEAVQAGVTIDLASRFERELLETRHVVLRLGSVLRRDQPPGGALREKVDGRVEEQRRDQERAEERQDSRDGCRVSVPAQRPSPDESYDAARDAGEQQPERRHARVARVQECHGKNRRKHPAGQQQESQWPGLRRQAPARGGGNEDERGGPEGGQLNRQQPAEQGQA